jgi:hypothetical protein
MYVKYRAAAFVSLPTLQSLAFRGPRVAAEPSGALEYEVDRRKIGHQDIKIEVEALLDHLGGNDNMPVSLLRFASRTKGIDHSLFDPGPIANAKSGVKKSDPLDAELGSELKVNLLRIVHGVADPRGALA